MDVKNTILVPDSMTHIVRRPTGSTSHLHGVFAVTQTFFSSPEAAVMALQEVFPLNLQPPMLKIMKQKEEDNTKKYILFQPQLQSRTSRQQDIKK